MQIANLNISPTGIFFQDKDGQKLEANRAFKKIYNRFYNYYLDTKLFFLWMVGYIPSHLVRNFFYQLSGIEMGKGSTIHMGARFYQPNNISIGKGTIIGDHAFLDGRATLKIGSHVDIASKVMIYNSQHDLGSPTMKAKEEPVEIGDYCFIGPRAIILPGVTLGKGAVVAAGAVVTENVPAGEVVGGIPAKKIKTRKLKNYTYRLGRPRLFQ